MIEGEIFTIRATHCRRCGGLLTSEQSINDGYGHVCKAKTSQEERAKRPPDGQISIFDIGGMEAERDNIQIEVEISTMKG